MPFSIFRGEVTRPRWEWFRESQSASRQNYATSNRAVIIVLFQLDKTIHAKQLL
jgi:hypothetical protein